MKALLKKYFLSIKSLLRKFDRKRITVCRIVKNKLILSLLYVAFERKRHKKNIDDIANFQSIGIVMAGTGIGDAILMSGLIKHLRDLGKTIYIICYKRQERVFNGIIRVDRVLIANENSIIQKDWVKSSLVVDVLIDVLDPDKNLYKRIGIIESIKHLYCIGVNQIDSRFFDINITRYEKNTHWSDRLISVLKELGIVVDRFSYDLVFNDKVKEDVEDFVRNSIRNDFIVFNPVASDKYRTLSEGFINNVLRFICENSKKSVVLFNVKSNAMVGKYNRIFYNPFDDLDRSFYMVSKCSLVITTDTSFVHVSNFFNARSICIYNNRKANGIYENNKLWGPNYENCTQVFSSEKRGTESGDDLRVLPFSIIEDVLRKELK